jgi:hypothetical protein
MSSWRRWSSRSSIERLHRSRAGAPDALVCELARRVAGVAPERRSRGAWARGGVAGAGIVSAAVVAGLAAIGAAGYPLQFVSAVARHVADQAVRVQSRQTSLRIVAVDPAISQYQTTTLTTELSARSITVGRSAYDEAALSGQTRTAGGTVSYTVYSDSRCTAGARSAGTVRVSNGRVPESSALSFNTPGVYYWQAVYSGDAPNSGSSSKCGSEQLTVAKASPQISTSFNLNVHNGAATAYDTATLSGATATAGGTVTYTVYTNSSCTAGARPAGTVTVTNGQVPKSNTLSFTSGTYYWIAAYTGDANNNAVSSTCGSEVMTLKIS